MAAIAIPAIIEAARDIFTKYIGDKAVAAQATADFAKRAQQQDFQLLLGQIEVNKEEAKSASTFASGWRPAIGWVCATSLAVYYIPRFVIGTTLWAIQAYHTKSLPPMPEMGIGDIIGLVSALLGMAGLRTVEKWQGVARP